MARTSTSKTTRDHRVIQRWAEERHGTPATVEGTSDGDAGILRIDFEEREADPRLKRISWEDFFKKFDEKNLLFLYQDKTKEGKQSRFFKFVSES